MVLDHTKKVTMEHIVNLTCNFSWKAQSVNVSPVCLWWTHRVFFLLNSEFFNGEPEQNFKAFQAGLRWHETAAEKPRGMPSDFLNEIQYCFLPSHVFFIL